MSKEILKEQYGFLFEERLIDIIDKEGTYVRAKQGEELIDIGQKLTHMPLLLSGAIKILREDDMGDELLLYFIERGDTCTMSLSCCIGSHKSEIRAIAETDSLIVMIPVHFMDEWICEYRSWRMFVLEAYQQRTKELLETVDTLAFLKMDQRILKFLQDKAKVMGNDIISTTHKEIAQDLHTSRVVVSRVLKKLEIEGKIKLNRNSIVVIDL